MKLLTSRIILAIALGLCWSALGAAPSQITAGTAVAARGRTASIPITFQVQSDSAALQFDVAYDTNRVTAGGALTTDSSGSYEVVSSEPRPGVRRVIIYSSGTRPLPSGTIATLSFLVAGSAPEGETEIKLENAFLSQLNGTLLTPIDLVAGKVSISATAAPVPSIARSTDGKILVEATGSAEKSLVLQGSSDLKQWTDVASNPPGGAKLVYQESANQPHRYFRAVSR